MIKINYLNHASVLISIDNVRLLTDPWFSGHCFSGGWGLRYDNPEALGIAKEATHLWISHFHSDHFHVATLKKILEINPNIILIGNDSFNFKLNQAGRSLGFQNVVSFKEREYLEIAEGISLIRYPTTGIDNMLLIKSKYGTLLNYNDCNLPSWSQKRLARKIGHIDIFMTNFNHAGKLLTSSPLNAADIRHKLRKNFTNNYNFFNVDFVFPFASYHYYRAPESCNQNDTMLDINDLLDLDEKILDVEIGCYVEFSNDKALVQHTGCRLVSPNQMDTVSRPNSIELADLVRASLKYSKTLRKSYWFLIYGLPELFIYIKDLHVAVKFHAARGISMIANDGQVHIAIHSSALYNWFNDLYGTDNFVVGAHFEIMNENKIPLKWQIVFGLLIDNKIGLSSLVKMLFCKEGLNFLLNRREEILGIIFERKLSAEYHD